MKFSKGFWLLLLLGVAVSVYITGNNRVTGEEAMNEYGQPKLTSQEESIIQGKGTERAFTGKYWDHHAEGSYTCRQCGAELFASGSKFDSGCGWPSFDKALPGAVKELPDADGRRTEIVCAKCGGHLGHVFRGEGMTELNTRHCVNSASLGFSPFVELGSVQRAKAIFAGGCFWGVEYHMQKIPGVISVESGYTGGTVDNPTYEQVCSGKTGHAEAVEITYDPAKVDYETLARLFLEIHDPTQVNRQGPDIGEQYRSEIFVVDEKQREVAQKLLDILKGNGMDIATKITPAGKFWKAENYHQDYYTKTGKAPYCHAYTKRF